MAETDKKMELGKVVNAPTNEEPKFFLYELRQHSQKLFGVKPEVFDGAFFDYNESQATKKEAEKRIQAFLKKEVKA